MGGGRAPPAGQPQADWFTPGGFHSFEHEWALADAFEFHKAVGGRTAIANRIHELNGQLKEGLAGIKKVKVLTPRGRELSAGIVVFNIDGIPAGEVISRLLEKKIVASASPYANPVARMSGWCPAIIARNRNRLENGGCDSWKRLEFPVCNDRRTPPMSAGIMNSAEDIEKALRAVREIAPA